MKSIISYVSVALMISFTANSKAQELNSSLTCEIKKQVILEMQEGKPKVYSGYEHGLDDGDKINIKLMASDSFVNVSLKNIEKDAILWLTNRNALAKNLMLSSVDAYFGKMITLTPEIIHDLDNDTSLTLTKNMMTLRTSKANFELSRYYKDDWSGVISLPESSLGPHLIGVNCTMDGEFNEIVDRIRTVCFSIESCKKTYEEYADINL